MRAGRCCSNAAASCAAHLHSKQESSREAPWARGIVEAADLASGDAKVGALRPTPNLWTESNHLYVVGEVACEGRIGAALVAEELSALRPRHQKDCRFRTAQGCSSSCR